MNVLSSLLNFIGNKIGSTSMGTSATTITGAIAEHENDISGITSNLGPMKWSTFNVSAGSSINLYMPSGSAHMIMIMCPSAAGRAFSLMSVTSTGTVVSSDVYNGGAISYNVSTSNHLVIANSAGSGARICIQTCQGNSPYLAT